MKAASGIDPRSCDSVLPMLVDLGVLTPTRHPSHKHRGRRLYTYTLVGSALNGQLQTIGHDRKRVRDRVRPLAAKKRPPVDYTTLDAGERRELEELRTWKQCHERCWVCG